MSASNFVKQHQQSSVAAFVLVVIAGLSIRDLAPAHRLDFLFCDAPWLVFAVGCLTHIWMRENIANPGPTSLTPTEAGTIATRIGLPAGMIAFQAAIVAWSAYGMVTNLSHGMPPGLLIVIVHLTRWRDWSMEVKLDCTRHTYQLREGLIPHSFTGSFEDILGSFVVSDDGIGDRPWSVYLIWRKRKLWTRVAAYYNLAEAQHQCDALSRALDIPVLSYVAAKKRRPPFSSW